MRPFHERVECGRNLPGSAAREPRVIGYEYAREGWQNKDNTDADSETGNATSIGCKAKSS